VVALRFEAAAGRLAARDRRSVPRLLRRSVTDPLLASPVLLV
jgi:hypothetical protein